MIFDPRRCALGEGPLWHPIREQLFWFDILNKKLLTQDSSGPREWVFPMIVSAAGWVDHNTLLIASETGLFLFDLEKATSTPLCDLEADQPGTRSNDGRADPFGGFWIGTMGKSAEAGAGAIYRYYRGEIRKLFKAVTIPNSISFPPDGKLAYFSDTANRQVMRVGLDHEGWPNGSPVVHLDLRDEGLNPDGAVVDADGTLWLAQWGAGRVAAYAPDGSFLRAIAIDAPHSSCPAFGGSTLYCTTAQEAMSNSELLTHPNAGKTFAFPDVARGQSEHKVII